MIVLASPATAQSSENPYSEALSSQYTRDQGFFSNHSLANLAARFNGDLTSEQRKALYFGPTTEANVTECLKKYNLDGEGPWPDIAVYPDCSFDVIEQDLYDDAVEEALSFTSLGSS